MSHQDVDGWGTVRPMVRRAAPVVAPLPRTARDLVSRGERELGDARHAADDADRFSHAHLAALRFAGAVIAARQQGTRRGPRRSAWQLLSVAEPSMSSWSAFFAAGAPVRAAIDAGGHDVVTAQEAQDWLAASEDFGDDVRRLFEEHARASVDGGPGPHGEPGAEAVGIARAS